MKMPTSFIGEHTVGLAICPILKEILHKKYELVTPIFPWMSREGGSVSKHLHEKDKFKIIGLYPRRPKISLGDTENIYLKINEQILLGAQTALGIGVPIIAGIPLVRDFWNLGAFPKCLWIKLDFKHFEDKEFRIGLTTTESASDELTRKLLTEYQILEYLSATSKTFDIANALDAFREIKMKSMNLKSYSSLAYMGGYKPIYFLIK